MLLGLLLLCVSLGSGCFVPPLDYANRQCPCAAGWVCDASTQACVKAGSVMGPTGVNDPGRPLPAGDSENVETPDAGSDAPVEQTEDAGPDAPVEQTEDDGCLTEGPVPDDCHDECPDDPDKDRVGDCGCGIPDLDSDLDGVSDCIDGCPLDPSKQQEGVCGCGVSEEDSDGDGSPDCADGCPFDADKAAAGQCGCGQREAPACDCPAGHLLIDDECVARCGDGITAPGEQCDDGNASNNDACTNDCQLAVCGDGFVWHEGGGGETCDDANGDANDGCAACQTVTCGNGIVEPDQGEYCDDGGTQDGDGCSSDCQGEQWELGPVTHSESADDERGRDVPVSRPCDDGSVAVGLFGRSGGWFDHFGLRCRDLDDGLSPTGSVYNADTMGSRGGGDDFAPLQCPGETLLVGLEVTHDSRFRVLTGYCRSGASIKAGHSNTSGIESTRTQDTGNTRDYAVTQYLHCPDGSVVTGLAGYDAHDGYPSMVHLLCQSMDAP